MRRTDIYKSSPLLTKKSIKLFHNSIVYEIKAVYKQENYKLNVNFFLYAIIIS